MAHILIVDDDTLFCDILQRKLIYHGHDITCVHTLNQALETARSIYFDIILLDVFLPDGDGLEMLSQFQDMPSSPEVIIVTGRADISGASLAIKTGAWDYVIKGSSLDDLILPIERAMEYRREKESKPRQVALKRKSIVGDSPGLTACLDQVAEVSCSDIPVLIHGESGTGKELFAWAIHENSKRASREFVVVDCAALPETLIESILFGHEAGAYTGAARAKNGLILEANGGTLFLDEIAELHPRAQKAFLRVLQEKRFRRVGGTEELFSDFRIIAATNQDLEEMVDDGRFRQDLMFRLNQATIKLPPLRERGADLQSLVYYRLRELALIQGVEPKDISPEFFLSLTSHPWPGNVRELFGALDHAVMNAGPNPTLYAVHLPERIRLSSIVRALNKNTGISIEMENMTGDTAENMPDLKAARQKVINEFERFYLERIMAVTRGDIEKAARAAGISKPQLYNLLRKHSVSR